MTDKVIFQQPFEIGGHEVSSKLPFGYDGPCAVLCASTDKTICAFLSLHDAVCAARYATTPDGGYGSVILSPCDVLHITHSDFASWAF